VKKSILASVILAVLTSLALGACGTSESAPAATGRRVAIEVGASGYDPAEVQATAGEAITLVFTRTSEEGCGGEVVIPAEDIRRELPLNRAVEVTLTPTGAGRLRFTCGMDMYDGAIVVR
jgi:plastocyanin domain-containing protein